MTSIRTALLVPALNEEAGLERTARMMRDAVDSGVVSQAVVLDGGSADHSVDVVRRAGVDVLSVADLLPNLGEVLGKGDSLFRGVHSVDADWYVFLDADLGNVSVDHVRALVEPIGRDGIVFVKGGFVRIDHAGRPREVPGGRVTEELVRPLLEARAPDLSRLSQPLSGQVAVRGDIAHSMRFVTGYGVEIAMLVDVWRDHGMGAIVEADMGEVQNRFKPDADLREVIADVTSALVMAGLAQEVGANDLAVRVSSDAI
ncbi:MAG: glycosyltransferase [Ilumatobacteraceae bacterium]